jgi:hypothetical protein
MDLISDSAFGLIISLFKDFFNHTVVPSNERMIVNNELQGTWKKVVMTYFKVLLLNLAGENDENHECLGHL